MAENLKDTIEELNRAFGEFKAANDQRLKEIEAKGDASAEVKSQVERANADVTKLQAKVEELTAAIRQVEVAAARTNAGGPVDAEARAQERLHARAFFARARHQPMDDVQIGDTELEQYRNYRRAFFAFMRRGDAVSTEFKNALSVGADPQGGLWVPPDTTARIVQLLYETSPMRQVATVETITADAYEGQTDLDEVESGWVGEKDSRPETGTADLGRYRIDLKEQYAAPKTTQRLIDTSMRDPEAWLTQKVADKLSRTENTAYVTGDGIKRPRGFTTYGNDTGPTASNWQRIKQYHSGASGAFASSNPADKILDMIYGLKAPYRANARFAASRLTFAEVRKLKDGQGNYLWQPSAQAGQPATLFNYGTVEFEDMAAIGANSISLAFADFKQLYTIVDHTTGLRMLRDPLTAKPWVIFYTTKYTGGDVVNFEAGNLMKFAA